MKVLLGEDENFEIRGIFREGELDKEDIADLKRQVNIILERIRAEQTEPNCNECDKKPKPWEFPKCEGCEYTDHTDYQGALDYTDTTDCGWK